MLLSPCRVRPNRLFLHFGPTSRPISATKRQTKLPFSSFWSYLTCLARSFTSDQIAIFFTLVLPPARSLSSSVRPNRSFSRFGPTSLASLALPRQTKLPFSSFWSYLPPDLCHLASDQIAFFLILVLPPARFLPPSVRPNNHFPRFGPTSRPISAI